MAKLRIPSQKKAYQQLKGRINQYTLLVQKVYETLALEAANIVTSLDYDGTEPFKFSDYPETTKRVKDLQTQFVNNLNAVIYSSTSAEWRESNLCQDLVADKAWSFYYGKKTKKGKRWKNYYQTNSDALKAFQQRVDNGMNLSQKIWNQAPDMKKELECALSAGIQKGMSAITLSKRISKYLNDFPSLKADYGERFGAAADVYDCEYRSMRLARTEINMAYRTAEQERWKQFDFVLGYEIKLSGSHPRPDICDDLKGKYPKNFKFTGWHPNCFCYCVPVLKTEDEFWDDTPSENEVKYLPDNFKQWMDDNKDRMAQGKSMPYFIKDNFKNGKLANGLEYTPDTAPFTILKEYKTTAQIDATFKDINATMQPGERWFENGDLRLFATTKKSVNGETAMDGRVWLKPDRMERVKSALGKIGQGKAQEITIEEADAMATFWHEITHNRNMLGNMYRTDTQTRYMELANEWVARNTLPEFYAKLGVNKMPYKVFTEHRHSTGYNGMVVNFDHVIDKLGLDKDKVMKTVKSHLFTEKYNSQEAGLKQGLIVGGLRYANSNKAVTKSDLNSLLRIIRTQEYDTINADGIFVSRLKTIDQWLVDHGFLERKK